ncbi:hypothetical protein FACS1894207_3050 [Bacteroidia bacterium]|nr:hypothetical protein FACS1894207_3050 [Bacteroidia bacterium]
MFLDFEIDELTHSIEKVQTGESFSTEVISLSKNDLKLLTKKNSWQFNWKEEFNDSTKSVYKLIIEKQSDIIQGLVSVIKKEDYLMLSLIENASFNLGKCKMFKGVAGNMVAFVCKLSLSYGFDGEIVFAAKTKLIAHYEQTLGAVHIGGQRMIIYEREAKALIKNYFPDYKTE